MLSKYGNCTRLLKIKNKLKIGCFFFTNKVYLLHSLKIKFVPFLSSEGVKIRIRVKTQELK